MQRIQTTHPIPSVGFKDQAPVRIVFSSKPPRQKTATDKKVVPILLGMTALSYVVSYVVSLITKDPEMAMKIRMPGFMTTYGTLLYLIVRYIGQWAKQHGPKHWDD